MKAEKIKVLIADQLSDKAIEILKSNKLAVDIKTGLKAVKIENRGGLFSLDG